MVTPAIVAKVLERHMDPGAFSWAQREEQLAMDLRPAKTTFSLVKPDSYAGFPVRGLGPKAALEAQMEAAARHAFDYGGKLPPLDVARLPPEVRESFEPMAARLFGGDCHECGLKGHHARECRGSDAYAPDGQLISPDQPHWMMEDITQIPAEYLVEAPIGARAAADPAQAEAERAAREERCRTTAERGRLTRARRDMLKMIKRAMAEEPGVGAAAAALMTQLGGPRGLVVGDVPGGLQLAPQTCSQLRTLFADALTGGDARPLIVSVSRKEGALRARQTRYAVFVWWGTEEVCRAAGDDCGRVVASAVERAWQISRERDAWEEDAARGSKRAREEDAPGGAEERRRRCERRAELVEALSGPGREALAAWKDDAHEIVSPEPIEFADVEGDEIRFEPWFGGGARYCVNGDARDPFADARLLPPRVPEFLSARVRCETEREFKSVQLPEKHAGVVEQLCGFFDTCGVWHDLGDSAPGRFETDTQSHAQRAAACRAAAMIAPPPPAADGRWS